LQSSTRSPYIRVDPVSVSGALARARRTASLGAGHCRCRIHRRDLNHAETFVNAYLNAFVFRFNNRRKRSIFKAVLADY
jgi:hypothetical protein